MDYDPNVAWDDSVEIKNVEEYAEFISCDEEVRTYITNNRTTKWIVEGEVGFKK
jgi:hypothetical protein